MADDLRRKELAAFLRSRRARLQPQDVGLSDGVGRRRTPGLRREEVSQLSGIGLTWYTWLEQGREIPISRQVVQALTTALRLDTDDYKHLCALAGLPEPRPDSVGVDVLTAVRRMLANLMPNPAYAMNECFDILAWNDAQSALWIDPGKVDESQRNLLWLMMTEPSVRTLVLDWEASASALVGGFRAAAGRHVDDPRFARLAGRLCATNPQFAEWWNTYPVAEFDVVVNELNHPRVGRIDLDLFHLELVEHPEVTIVLQTPKTPTDVVRLATLLKDGPVRRHG